MTPIGLPWLLLAPLCAVALLTMGFVGHDAGHYALSRKRWVNDVWGQFGMTFLCGMSFGFWRSRHNLHHSHCQEVGGDPDMHFGVLFSVYPQLRELADAARPFLPEDPEVVVLAAVGVLLGRPPLRRDPRSVPAAEARRRSTGS